jgi:hypothetical protein
MTHHKSQNCSGEYRGGGGGVEGRGIERKGIEGRDIGKGEFKGKVGKIRRGGKEAGEGVGEKGSRRGGGAEGRMGRLRWRKGF